VALQTRRSARPVAIVRPFRYVPPAPRPCVCWWQHFGIHFGHMERAYGEEVTVADVMAETPQPPPSHEYTPRTPDHSPPPSPPPAPLRVLQPPPALEYSPPPSPFPEDLDRPYSPTSPEWSPPLRPPPPPEYTPRSPDYSPPPSPPPAPPKRSRRWYRFQDDETDSDDED